MNRTAPRVHRLLLALAAGLAAHAQAANPAALRAFPDFLQVRSEFLSAVVTAPTAAALDFKTAYRDTPVGRVRVSVERSAVSFYVMFQRERADGYGASRGDVFVTRDAAKGFLQRVTWVLSDDGRSWIALTPKNEKTVVDYVVAGQVVKTGYVVSQLVYYFFMQPFAFLHDSTRAGLDWTLVLGSEGPDAALGLAASLMTDQGVGAALLAAAAAPTGPAAGSGLDPASAAPYLAAAGRTGSLAAEITAPAFERVVLPGDVREPDKPVAATMTARGFSMTVATGILLRASAEGAAFVASLDGGDGWPPARLAIVPYRDADGCLAVLAVDGATGRPVDWFELERTRPDTSVRLFRLPLPRS